MEDGAGEDRAWLRQLRTQSQVRTGRLRARGQSTSAHHTRAAWGICWNWFISCELGFCK